MRNKIFAITFILLAFIVLKYYPVNARVADHIRFGYMGLCLFSGAYFLSRK